MKIIEVQLTEIQLDERAQPRCELNKDLIEEYAEAWKAGAKFPPIDVFEGPEGMILADGYHRFKAAKLADLIHLPAVVHEGSHRDAILFAVGANATHGLRRSADDKRRSILILLRDEEWRKFSDNEVAKRCHVSRRLVATLRGELHSQGSYLVQAQDGTVTARRRGRSYKINTTKIGQKERGPKPEAETSPGTEKKSPPRNKEPEAVKRFLVLHATLSTLPGPEIIGDLITSCKRKFSTSQALEGAAWFNKLAERLEMYERIKERRSRSRPMHKHAGGKEAVSIQELASRGPGPRYTPSMHETMEGVGRRTSVSIHEVPSEVAK